MICSPDKAEIWLLEVRIKGWDCTIISSSLTCKHLYHVPLHEKWSYKDCVQGARGKVLVLLPDNYLLLEFIWNDCLVWSS